VLLFKTNARDTRLVALVVEADGVAIARVSREEPERPLLEYCAFHPLAPGQEHLTLLRKSIAAPHLDKIPITTLLATGDYQLLMVEAPEVPPAELRAAIRWRLRDLIDFHIDDAVLDVFDVPPSGARGVQQHLYVVVSRAELVKARVELLQSAGAELKIIDIPELALRNLAARLDLDINGQAMLHFGSDHGLITLTRAGTLYLARTMDMGYKQLCETPDLVDRLALELQRSMDYYDRHFQQAPITSVTLCPLPAPVRQLAEQLARQTGIAVHQLRVEDLVDVDPAVDHAQFPRCTLAIGAALRSDPAQL
jgi:MSHA biogenesis protein MshI